MKIYSAKFKYIFFSLIFLISISTFLFGESVASISIFDIFAFSNVSKTSMQSPWIYIHWIENSSILYAVIDGIPTFVPLNYLSFSSNVDIEIVSKKNPTKSSTIKWNILLSELTKILYKVNLMDKNEVFILGELKQNTDKATHKKTHHFLYKTIPENYFTQKSSEMLVDTFFFEIENIPESTKSGYYAIYGKTVFFEYSADVITNIILYAKKIIQLDIPTFQIK